MAATAKAEAAAEEAAPAAPVGEPSPRRAWRRCLGYWALGAAAFGPQYAAAAVGARAFAALRGGAAAKALVAGAAATTLLCTRKYDARTVKRGRPPSLAAALLFGGLNGRCAGILGFYLTFRKKRHQHREPSICRKPLKPYSSGKPPDQILVSRDALHADVCSFETLWYLASYDLGARLLLPAGSGTALRFGAGFLTHSIFAAVIHAAFWLPLGFPDHVDPEAPKFTSDMLPWLIAASLSWFAIYEATGDGATVAALHMMLNVIGSRSMNLQPPWAEAEGAQQDGGDAKRE